MDPARCTTTWNLALGTYFVVDELVVPVEVLLLLVNRWRVVVGVLVVVVLISIVVVVVVVAVEWGTQGRTSLSARRRANAVVMTLRVMMIIMMIVAVVVLVVLAALRYQRIRWIGLHKIYHNTSATIGRRHRQDRKSVV